jgi:hypothetical protein
LFGARYRYSAISVAYSIGAILTGFIPTITLLFGEATGYAWWHPGVVLALLSVLTAVSAFLARSRTAPIDEV